MCEVTPDGDIIVGRTRPKNNPLIHRAVVGKPSFHNDMPSLPEDYTFGAPLKRDSEGAGEVMLSWQAGPNKKVKRPDRRLVADPDRVYGAKSGDAACMADLMQNRYELEWVNEQKTRHDSSLKAQEREHMRKKAPTRIAQERDQRIKNQQNTAIKPHPKEYFTLKAFRDVPSRFRSRSPAVGGSRTQSRLATATPEPSYQGESNREGHSDDE